MDIVSILFQANQPVLWGPGVNGVSARAMGFVNLMKYPSPSLCQISRSPRVEVLQSVNILSQDLSLRLPCHLLF